MERVLAVTGLVMSRITNNQGSRSRHNTVSHKLDKLQLPGWARLEFPGRSSTVTTHFAAHTRQAHRCNPQLRSRRDPRWTLLLFYYNILTATVTFIDWCIYLMIIRRRYLFSNKTSQNIHVKSIVLQYILLLWRALLPDEDPGRSLNPLETGWYPKKVPEPGPGCRWCRHTVTDAWWCVTAPCNDRLLFSSGPNWISWTR